LCILYKRLCLVPHLSETSAAVNGAVFAGLEGNLRCRSALGADGVELLALSAAGVLPLVAASLATLGFIGETLFGIELLLARCESEFAVAILANECSVFEHVFDLA